jgi:hypothetical protein
MSSSLEEPPAAASDAPHAVGRDDWRICACADQVALDMQHLLARRLKPVKLE